MTFTDNIDDMYIRISRLICDYKDGIADDKALLEALSYLQANWYQLFEGLTDD